MYDPSRPTSRASNQDDAIHSILTVLQDTYPNWELECHDNARIFLSAPDGRVVDCMLIDRQWKVITYQRQSVDSPANETLAPAPNGFVSESFDDVYDWLIKNVPAE
jgi:hypothetical protein